MTNLFDQFIQDTSLVCVNKKLLPFNDLFSFLKTHHEIQNLIFNGCDITISHHVDSDFLNNLQFFYPIYVLDISNNNLGNLGLHLVMKHLSYMTPAPSIPTKAQYLKSLNFSYCNLQDNEVGICALMVVARKQLLQLTDLNLSHNYLSTKAINLVATEWIKGALQNCIKLDISHNNIDISCLKNFIEKIIYNKFNLNYLIFENNTIDNIGTIEINDTLTKLNINSPELISVGECQHLDTI